MPDLKTNSECIELICAQGCTTVREVIVKLEKQQPVEELSHLNHEQKQIVLTELISIMAVYDEPDNY